MRKFVLFELVEDGIFFFFNFFHFYRFVFLKSLESLFPSNNLSIDSLAFLF